MNIALKIEPFLVEIVLRVFALVGFWLLLSVIVLIQVLAHNQTAVVLDQFCSLGTHFSEHLLLVGQRNCAVLLDH